VYPEPSPPQLIPAPRTDPAPEQQFPSRPWWRAFAWGALGVGAFYAAYFWSWAAPLTLLYLLALVMIAKARTWRQAFYPALAVGFGLSLLHLRFFWTIFSGGATVLWLVYSVWLGAFAILLRGAFNRLPHWIACLSIPFLWVGLEFFRSELYYLRFSWVTPTLAFYRYPEMVLLPHIGVYGSAFLLASLVALAFAQKRRLCAFVLLIAISGMGLWHSLRILTSPVPEDGRILRLAGVQMEFPTEKEVLVRLTELARRLPDVSLFVLSEYTFNEPVPEKVKAWCRANRRYLILGATEPLGTTNFYNTAFVISPEGEVIFRQVKAVPIQFFKDGLAAPVQEPWNSPWGKIGICICYDLSYTRVTDTLVRQGAEMLVVPTMDVADWGRAQHELHARIAPVRAAEYGIPIFRLASSGVSQAINAAGHEIARAPFPGEGAVLSQALVLKGPGKIPPDRWLAWVCFFITLAVGCGLTGGALAERLRNATFFRQRNMTGVNSLL
jgi:apolipoprotein N-acyltransferase